MSDNQKYYIIHSKKRFYNVNDNEFHKSINQATIFVTKISDVEEMQMIHALASELNARISEIKFEDVV